MTASGCDAHAGGIYVYRYFLWRNRRPTPEQRESMEAMLEALRTTPWGQTPIEVPEGLEDAVLSIARGRSVTVAISWEHGRVTRRVL